MNATLPMLGKAEDKEMLIFLFLKWDTATDARGSESHGRTVVLARTEFCHVDLLDRFMTHAAFGIGRSSRSQPRK